MRVLLRSRLVLSAAAVLLLVFRCEAEQQNEAQTRKVLSARGNQWAVGHLMGKKSIDDFLGLDDRDVDAQGYLTAADTKKKTRPPRLMNVLVKMWPGLEREKEDEREKQEHLREPRSRWEEQLARDRGTSRQRGFYYWL